MYICKYVVDSFQMALLIGDNLSTPTHSFFLIVRTYVIESFKTYRGLSEYTLTACSTERLNFLVLTNDICISSSTEKLDKTETSLIYILYKNRLSIRKINS